MHRPAPAGDDDAALAQTLAAARAHFGGYDVLGTQVGAPAGWCAAGDLNRAGPELEALLARAVQRTGSGRADIGATLLAESYAFALALRAVGTLLFGTRIPAMAPDEVSLQFADDGTTIIGVAFTGGCFGIAGDPCTGDPSLVVLPDEAALLAALLTELQAHLDPLLAALAAATGRPLRALWRSAGDRLGGAFLWLGEVVGMRERAWDLGTRCMQADGPLAVGAGFRVLEHAGIAEPTRNRRSCCLIYRAPDNDTCFTCPLTSEAQRCERLAARATQPA